MSDSMQIYTVKIVKEILSMIDYCENCYYITIMKMARPKRMLTLVVDDKSQLEMPPVDADELKKKFDENLLHK
ncbi:hypothetical protein CAEBREN_12929 [Caenorhabditis brenneri]|uniref:Uncharacterized protein n=1 Tax=Caenorhabditis brenneri TaxID=135651 RepID=G0MXF9_CAEBE|nr:hypothetical protein CAEBREN_12929 [Caenorhabditis brenneri]